MKPNLRFKGLLSLLLASNRKLAETRAGILIFVLGAALIGVYGPAMISGAASETEAGASLRSPDAALVQVGTPNDDEGNPMPAIPVRSDAAAASIARFEAEHGIEVVGPLNDDEGNAMPAAPPRLTKFVSAPAASDYRLEREGCCFGSDRLARLN